MIKDQIGKVIKERIRNCDELYDEWDYGLEQCHKDAVIIFENDINETISFFENDCSDEEFYWLSEVFEDIAEKTQSEEFIASLRNRLAKVHPESYCQQNFKSKHMQKWVDYTEYVRSISSDIDFAECRIDDYNQASK